MDDCKRRAGFHCLFFKVFANERHAKSRKNFRKSSPSWMIHACAVQLHFDAKIMQILWLSFDLWHCSWKVPHWIDRLTLTFFLNIFSMLIKCSSHNHHQNGLCLLSHCPEKRTITRLDNQLRNTRCVYLWMIPWLVLHCVCHCMIRMVHRALHEPSGIRNADIEIKHPEELLSPTSASAVFSRWAYCSNNRIIPLQLNMWWLGFYCHQV